MNRILLALSPSTDHDSKIAIQYTYYHTPGPYYCSNTRSMILVGRPCVRCDAGRACAAGGARGARGGSSAAWRCNNATRLRTRIHVKLPALSPVESQTTGGRTISPVIHHDSPPLRCPESEQASCERSVGVTWRRRYYASRRWPLRFDGPRIHSVSCCSRRWQVVYAARPV